MVHLVPIRLSSACKSEEYFVGDISVVAQKEKKKGSAPNIVKDIIPVSLQQCFNTFEFLSIRLEFELQK